MEIGSKFGKVYSFLGVKAHYGEKDTVFLLIYSFPLVKNRYCIKCAM